MDRDLRLAHLAGRRSGTFSRVEARNLGFSTRAIHRRVAAGRWHQLARDVFALPGFPANWTQRCAAATLLHPAAALSHRTAATRLGLDGFAPGAVHVTVPPCGHHGNPLATVHRSRHHAFTLVGGLRTTTFAQTIVQLAADVDDRVLAGAVHSGIHADPRRIDELRVRLGLLRNRRMPGLGRVVGLLDDLDGEPPTASALERLLFEVVGRVPGMPPIRRQRAVPWCADRSTIVDGFVEVWGLVLEADGRRWHTRVADFERDRWRDAEAAAHGLHVMRFSWHRLRHDADGVVDVLSRFGARFAQAA